MQVAENHHTDPKRPLAPVESWLARLVTPALLLLITVGFFWKLVLTNQYTWLESPDLANQVLPWLQFQAGEWHRGSFPMWDPYLWGGQSLIGQAQPGAAYPLNWILFLLPLKNGWIRQAYLHWYYVILHFLAVLFCYLLCRGLRRSRAASLLAGLAFGFGGYVGTTDWPQMLNGAIWAPLVFLFLLRSIAGVRPWSSAALSGMFLGISWLSGHHQIPIYVTLAAGGIWAWRIFQSGRPDWRILRLAAIFGIFVLLTGALQILPAYEYGKLARRWVGTPDPVGWKDKVPYLIHSTYALYPLSMLGTFIPGLHRHSNPYVGLVALSLGALAVALNPRSRHVRLFGLLAVAGLLFSLGHNNVFHGILYAVLPILEKARTPATAIFIFQFGVSVLTAYGFDTFAERTDSTWTRRAGLALLALAALLLALSTAALVLQKQPDERYAMTALMALLTAGILYGWDRGYLSSSSAATLLTLVLLIELGNVSGYAFPHRLEKERRTYLSKMQEHADIAAFLRQQPFPVRVELDDKDIPYNFGDWYGLDTFAGYVASLPSNLLEPGMHDWQTRRLFGVGYSIAPKPVRETQREVFRGRAGLNVYANPDAFPRVWAVHEIVHARNYAEVYHYRNNPEFDMRRKAFMTAPPPRLESCPAGEDSVRMIRREPNRLEIEADMECRGMVVLSENYFPGWTAKVDGKPVQIYEVYGVLRGVVAEGGKHRIEMRYWPLSVRLGAAMTALGLAGALALALADRRRSSA